MKNFSKKGFSLLEVMLAVAIMAVTSSMIMYGFLASMNYANNSSIYARVAAHSERGGYYRISEMTAITNRTTRYTTLSHASNGTPLGTIALQGGPLPSDAAELYIGGFKFDTEYGTPDDSATFDVASIAVPLDAAYGDSLEGGSGGYGDATVADNRTSFFYTIPDTTFPPGYGTISNGRCPVCGAEYTLAMYRRGGDTTSYNYHWVCTRWNDDTEYDHSAYRAAVLANW